MTIASPTTLGKPAGCVKQIVENYETKMCIFPVESRFVQPSHPNTAYNIQVYLGLIRPFYFCKLAGSEVPKLCSADPRVPWIL